MAVNTSISVASFDFDALKEDFKTFLQTQSAFRDFDYEGSNINVLLSLLSYNTQKNAFLHNMVMSEAFSDTAQLRASLVSHAKHLNYVPGSVVSPVAVVQVTFNTGDADISSFLIPKGTEFSGSNANGSFQFVTDRNRTITSSNGSFTIADLSIYQGSYVNETYVVNTGDETQRFILSNPSIDIASIEVTVYEDNGATELAYVRQTHLYDVTDTTKCYFVQAYDERYEIVFGDGVFGRVPKNGATILITYRVTAGTKAGGVQSFVINEDLGPINGIGSMASSPTVVTVSRATAGSDRETLESIRFRAPRGFQTQQRAVIASDYSFVVKNNFPEIKAVHTFGGEEYTQLRGTIDYGKVYISPITYAGTSLSENRKTDIKTFLKDKVMSVGLRAEIVDPEFLYVLPTISIKYDQSKTNSSPYDVQQSVIGVVEDYNDGTLKNFNTVFVESALSENIMALDDSMFSVTISTRVRKNISPTLIKPVASVVLFNNALAVGSLTSSKFLLSDGGVYTLTDYNPYDDTITKVSTTNGVVMRNSSNKVFLKKTGGATNVQSYKKCGTIDYSKGTISLNSMTVIDFMGSTGIEIYASPTSNDVTAKYNDIIEIDVGEIAVTAKAIRTNNEE